MSSLPTNPQIYTHLNIEGDLKELIQLMSTWPTWKIDSLQNSNRNISPTQILYQKISVTKKE